MYDLIDLKEILKNSKDVDEDFRLSVVNIFVDWLKAFERAFRNLRFPQRCNPRLTFFRDRSRVSE